MKVVLNGQQWDHLCAEIIKIATKLRETGPTLLVRSRIAVRDGYPRSSLGGTGSAPTVLDDQGMPMPPLSDPTGELVAAGGMHDEYAEQVALMVGKVNQAAALLAQASSHGGRLLPATSTLEDDVEACQSCARANVFSVVDPDTPRLRRCSWCNAWRRTHGGDPPVELIRVRESGRRITSKVIADVTGKAKAS